MLRRSYATLFHAIVEYEALCCIILGYSTNLESGL